MDQNRLLKVPTFKSGNFVFSACYDEAALAPSLLELDVTKRIIFRLPVLPRIYSEFKGDLVRKSIHGTAAIEGNPLNESEVGDILNNNDSFEPANDRQREITNLKKAYERFVSIPQSDTPLLLEEKLIRDIHAVITDSLTVQGNIPGQYRNILVEVGDKDHGGKYLPPKIFEDIKSLMAAFIDWINSDTITSLHPLIRAALTHYHLGLIHPFRDGNGRTARLIEAMMLSSSGWKHVGTMLSSYYYKNIDDYYIAFRLSETDKAHSVTPFLTFIVNGVKDRLEDLHANISSGIRHIAIKDYISFLKSKKKISQRQHDLAMIIFDLENGFNAADLHSSPFLLPIYRSVSEQTARRDIKRLLEHRIIVRVGERYHVNLHALDS